MMPFYGDPALFRRAVESVMAQTDPGWRLVVVDDVYPDPAPGEWLRGIDDARIRYVRNETNLGVSGNFSRCLELVESDHFVLMGCDDLLEPTYVERIRAAISEHPTASYFQPGVTVVDGSGAPSSPLPDTVKRLSRPRTRSTIILSGQKLASSLLRGNWTYFPSICWSTDVVRRYGFADGFEVVLDLALQLEIICGGGSLVVLPERLFRYRRHAGSVSRSNRFLREALHAALVDIMPYVRHRRPRGEWNRLCGRTTRQPTLLCESPRQNFRCRRRHVRLYRI